MASHLITVRLDDAYLRKARKLRETGVALSDLVRKAIDDRLAALERAQKPRDVKHVVQRVFEQYPDPPDLPAQWYDVHDARSARASVRRGLARKPR